MVSDDPTKPNPLTKLVASLVGAFVVTPLLFEDGPCKGPVLAHHMALRQSKFVWMSDAVRQGHPDVINIIQTCMDRVGKNCNWGWRTREWLTTCKVGRRAYAIISKKEHSGPGFAVARGVQVLTLAAFLRSLVSVDSDLSFRGTACGR